MTTQHLSIRIGTDTLDRLDAESQRERISRSELARTLIEEGLRMQAHPGIVFRQGPTGRRAGLMAGPDVWELIRVFHQLEESGDELVARLAEIATVQPYQVRAALRYYADYPDEIDGRIALDEAEAERAEAVSLREHALLQR